MRDWEICSYCKSIINGVYSSITKYTINNGVCCDNSIDDDDICNTCVCNSCIEIYFNNKYHTCHFCKNLIYKIE